MNYIKNVFYGMIIGLANIIPGVSGGTMAVVLNVFDELIYSISNIKKEFKKSSKFLSAILIGAVIAIVAFSNLITVLLDNYYMITNFFFIGVVVGSIPMVYKKATVDSFKPLHILPCIITLAIMLVSVYLVPDNSSEVIIRSLSPFVAVKLVLISSVASFCMIVPGISGSFVMLLFGMYETITTAVSEMNIIVLIPIGIGVLIGILLGSKALAGLLKKYPQATYFAILGFMLGSIPAIFNKISSENAFVGGISLFIAIAVFIIGAGLSLLFSSEKFKSMITNKNK